MIKPLTSLRFFFAFMVFLSHIDFVNTNLAWYNWLKRNIFFEGYLGVSFFFILSGFILSYSYQEKFIYRLILKKEFYVARFARIFPLHVITLFLILPFIFHKQLFNNLKFLLNLSLLQSFIPKQEYFFSFNSPSWSISNEMFFYLLFPLLIFIFNKYNFLKKLILFISPFVLVLSIFITESYIHKTIFYVNPIIRSFDFILGIILYDIYKNKRFSDLFKTTKRSTIIEIGAIIVFLAFHNYFVRGYRFSVYYWIPMCFIIFVFAHQKGYISKILSNKWLVFLGEISFGFYMIHYLVIKYGLWLKSMYFNNLNDIIFSIIVLLITITLSYLSFIFYEKPMNFFIKKKLLNK